MEVTIVRERAGLEALSAEWAALVLESKSPEPMLLPDWLLPWWDIFGGLGGRKLRVLAVRDRGRLVGLLPLLSRLAWRRPGLPFRRLELLGTGEPEADEIVSEYLGAVAARGAEPEVAAALARALAESSWDELVLPAMDGSIGMPAIVRDALARRGIGCALEATSQAPYIPLPKSFDDYLSALPGERRYLVRRSLRDLEKYAGGELRYVRAESAADLARGRDILVELHESRWAEAGKAGVFASERFRAFHDAVLPRFLGRGGLELAWLSARGEPVAVVYNLVLAGRVRFYQGGRRPLAKGLRPGIALHALCIRRAIEAGLTEYDFLGGAARYKRDLALSSRPLVRLRATRSRLRDGAGRVFEAAVRRLRPG